MPETISDAVQKLFKENETEEDMNKFVEFYRKENEYGISEHSNCKFLLYKTIGSSGLGCPVFRAITIVHHFPGLQLPPITSKTQWISVPLHRHPHPPFHRFHSLRCEGHPDVDGAVSQR